MSAANVQVTPGNVGTGLTGDVLAYVEAINGQDTYNAKADAVGKLDAKHHLFVPKGFMPNDTNPEDVGSTNYRANWNADMYAKIYVLNKAAFDSEEEKIKGALLRAELVKAGWYTSMYEVTQVYPPADYAATFTADLAQIREYHAEASELAMLLPLAAEHVFRTMGHHFISGLKSDFTRKYTQFFSACVRPNLVRYLPAEMLYHRVAHWVSLSLALLVARDPGNADRLPNAVVIRAYAAPAGSALIATSAAVLEALSGTGLGKSLKDASGMDLALVKSVTKAVKVDPGKYHVIPSAYGNTALTKDELNEFTKAKDTASALAPVLQGFIDSLPRTSDLTGARALSKHADINPLLRKRAKAFFKEVGSSKAANMQELFAMDKRTIGATGGEDIVGDDDDSIVVLST